MYALTTDAANVLWFGADDGLYAFDGTTETKVPVLNTRIRAIAEISGTTAKVVSPADVFTVDVTNGEESEHSPLANAEHAGRNAACVK